jgi:hypothetical protein
MWPQDRNPGESHNYDCYLDLDQFSESAVYSDQAGRCSDEGHESANMEMMKRTGATSKRQPFKNPHDRKQTAETRKLAACVRCRMQRIRVRKSIPVFEVIPIV